MADITFEKKMKNNWEYRPAGGLNQMNYTYYGFIAIPENANVPNEQAWENLVDLKSLHDDYGDTKCFISHRVHLTFQKLEQIYNHRRS
ncbi:hypothetical protein KRR40_11015 [Niabella defluvii]|nr:hypothetical protein KRR40_11015 [Niabella sp. I65]